MMLQQPSAAVPGATLFGHLYTALWAVLATLALFYLGFIFQHPDRLLTSKTAAAESRTEPRHSAREVEALRRTIADLQGELSELRLAMAVRQQEQEDASRAAKLDPDPPRVVPMPPESPPPASKGAPAIAMAAAEPVLPRPSSTPPPVPAAKSKPPAALETGSLAPSPPSPIAFGPAVVRPAPAQAPVALRLATSQSVEALRVRWSLLSERHGSTLRNLEPRYQAEGTGEARNYQLIAGPVRSAEEAKRLCATLRAKNESCSVGGYGGQAL
jgi:hypothetical protein